MSNKPTILIAISPKLPAIDPAEMQYGGIQRCAYWYMEAFMADGYDVLPVLPNDTELPFDFDREVLWPEPGLCSPNREPKAWDEDVNAAYESYAKHVVRVAVERDPDALFLLGPRFNLLRELRDNAPNLLSRTIVSLRNGPHLYGADMLDLLEHTPAVRVFALTELHRQSFAPYLSRIEAIRDGIPVDQYEFSADPAQARPEVANSRVRNPARKLISQIDEIASTKGQLLALHMFEQSGLHRRGYDFMIGGDFGAQLPAKAGGGAYRDRELYLEAMEKFIVDKALEDNVYLVGPLNGAEVNAAYRCSDFVLAPHRMDHGDLWDSGEQTAEAYGCAMGIAMASGAPVVCSDRVEPDRMEFGVTGYRFHDINSGVEAMNKMADDCERGIDRKAVRAFSETHDSIEPALDAYKALFRSTVS